MKFWISGEVMADVFDGFREAANEVEDYLNERFAVADYGLPLQKLVFIAIILPPVEDAYEEIFEYDKRKRTVEARLRVNHRDFRSAPDRERRKSLLLDAIEIAIARIGELKITADHQRLLADFQNLRSA